MTVTPELIFKRQPFLLEKFGFKKSTLYTRIQDGLIVPSVSLGGKIVAWPEHEIELILRAMYAGKSSDEIKELVTELVAKRSELI